MKKQTKEVKAKIAAAKNEKKKSFSEQTINIGDDFRIIRFDELNWQIQRKTDGWAPYPHQNYYGKLTHALVGLPDAMLNWKAKESLLDIKQLLNTLREEINEISNN